MPKTTDQSADTAMSDQIAIDLDPAIHGPKRLAVMAILSSTKEAEFAYLQRRLELSSSDLSKQMATLVDATLVAVRKTGHGRGGATWYSITEVGSARFQAYRAMLLAIIDEGAEGEQGSGS